MSDALLDIRDLRVSLTNYRPHRVLVEDVSLSVPPGGTVGLVGESGSGKSMTIKAAMRLLPRHADVCGGIEFEGRPILELSHRDLARYRASDVSLIHQDPRSHIDPLSRIGDFIVEGVVASGMMRRPAAEARAVALLEEMGIADAGRRLGQFPHQLSGGLLQRVVIAAALINEPKLVFADEPTTALDVTVQSDVMAILLDEVRARHVGMLFVTHDLDLAPRSPTHSRSCTPAPSSNTDRPRRSRKPLVTPTRRVSSLHVRARANAAS